MSTKMEFTSIDLETTSLNDTGEIVQIGCVVFIITKEEGVWVRKETNRYSSYVKYMHPEFLDKKAMAVNKIPKRVLEAAPNPWVVKEEYLNWWEEELNGRKLLPAGQNYGGFDKPFLKTFLAQYYDVMFDYHSFDTWTLAKTCQMLGVLPEDLSLSLADVAEHFGIERLDHLAIPDALNAIEVTVKLLNLLEEM